LILVGFFGVLARAPFFAHRYCAMAAASATMVVMGIRPMNTNIMRRRVVDPPLFHLANDRQSIVSCGIFVGSTCLPFSETSISKAWPALVNGDNIAAVQSVCARANALRCAVRHDVRFGFLAV
jgi:hypothetical protein